MSNVEHLRSETPRSFPDPNFWLEMLNRQQYHHSKGLPPARRSQISSPHPSEWTLLNTRGARDKRDCSCSLFTVSIWLPGETTHPSLHPCISTRKPMPSIIRTTHSLHPFICPHSSSPHIILPPKRQGRSRSICSLRSITYKKVKKEAKVANACS